MPYSGLPYSDKIRRPTGTRPIFFARICGGLLHTSSSL